jgi:hypothetical protein
MQDAQNSIANYDKLMNMTKLHNASGVLPSLIYYHDGNSYFFLYPTMTAEKRIRTRKSLL